MSGSRLKIESICTVRKRGLIARFAICLVRRLVCWKEKKEKKEKEGKEGEGREESSEVLGPEAGMHQTILRIALVASNISLSASPSATEHEELPSLLDQ